MKNNENASHINKEIQNKDQNRKMEEKQQGTPTVTPTYFIASRLGVRPKFLFILDTCSSITEYNYLKHIADLIIVLRVKEEKANHW